MALERGQQLAELSEALRARLAGRRPQVGLVLGSGIEADSLPLADPIAIPATELPHVPSPRVSGHGEHWISATLGGRSVLLAGGRSHLYEGVSLWSATIGVRAMAEAGCSALVVTNAAGGIRDDLGPGTLMLIRDHLNLQGNSPLVGALPVTSAGESRFVDLSRAYHRAWLESAERDASGSGAEIATGVYAAVLGPQYETPAEIRFLRLIGADAVGMSTVPEVIVARHCGLNVLGASLITNRAAGLSAHALDHEEVLEEGRRAADTLAALLPRWIASAPVSGV